MKRVFLWSVIGCGVLFLFILATNIYIQVATQGYLYNDVALAPTAEVALIPGAALARNGTPSPIFIDRANIAIALYKAGKVAKILVSGDNSTLSHNEVNPMRLYLLSQEIPDQDIFLDHAGFDTYSTMYRARSIFGISSVLIATQSFHLPRAVFIALNLGMEAYGVNADKGHILLRNYIREVLADEKAVFDLLLNRKPKYLGDTIPITEDGRNYP